MERLTGVVMGKGQPITGELSFKADLNYTFSPSEIAARESLSRYCEELYKRGTEIINFKNTQNEAQTFLASTAIDLTTPLELGIPKRDEVIIFEAEAA